MSRVPNLCPNFNQTRTSASGQLRSFEQANNCSECSSFVEIIVSIEDPIVIQKILAHLDEKVTLTGADLVPESRAPPATGLFA